MLTMEDKKQMKLEAIERMKILKLNKQAINDFITNNTIYVSNIKGSLQKANEEQMKLVKQYEEERQIKIYHIVHHKTYSKDILYLQYVDNIREHWRVEKRDIDLGFDDVICYKISNELREIRFGTKEGIINFIKSI